MCSFVKSARGTLLPLRRRPAVTGYSLMTFGLFFAAVSLLLTPAFTSHAGEIILNNAPARVCFSPHGGCTEAIIRELDKARSEILVQAYSFTSAPLAKALVDAHKRGVKVEAILDKSQRSQRYTSATFLANSRIPTFIDDRHAIAHNKVMVIDQSVVVTGSFNFTKAAEEKNAENVLILKSPEVARAYRENWHRHREHSTPYKERY